MQWLPSPVSTSSPRSQWQSMAIWLAIVPLGTNSAAGLPSSSAARSCSRFTVGCSPYTSSPTSAAAIAARIAGVGRVTVSLRRSMVFMRRAYRAAPEFATTAFGVRKHARRMPNSWSVMAAELDLGDAQRGAPPPASRFERPVGGAEMVRDQFRDLAELLGMQRLQGAGDTYVQPGTRGGED